MNQIALDAVINEAYKWLCKRRKDYHHNDDVWHLRYHWETFRPLIQEQLRSGRYRFSPVRLIRGTAKNGFSWLWSAADALVLKATALVLGDFLRPIAESIRTCMSIVLSLHRFPPALLYLLLIKKF